MHWNRPRVKGHKGREQQAGHLRQVPLVQKQRVAQRQPVRYGQVEGLVIPAEAVGHLPQRQRQRRSKQKEKKPVRPCQPYPPHRSPSPPASLMASPLSKAGLCFILAYGWSLRKQRRTAGTNGRRAAFSARTCAGEARRAGNARRSKNGAGEGRLPASRPGALRLPPRA